MGVTCFFMCLLGTVAALELAQIRKTVWTVTKHGSDVVGFTQFQIMDFFF